VISQAATKSRIFLWKAASAKSSSICPKKHNSSHAGNTSAGFYSAQGKNCGLEVGEAQQMTRNIVGDAAPTACVVEAAAE
jgi:hypothetical protein